ncbi:MAG: hypothetical protein ACPHJD_00680 [Poseidonia sp.]
MQMNPQPRRWRPVIIVLMVLMFSFFPNSSQAAHLEADAPPLVVVFHHENTTFSDGTINLSGTSNLPLRNTTWSIVNISGQTPITLLSGPFLTSVSPVSEGEFAWTLVVERASHSCTCYIELRAEDSGHIEQRFSTVVYLGDQHHRPVLLGELHPTMMTLEGQPTLLSDEGNFLYETELSLPQSSTELLQVFGSFCEAPFGVCVSAPDTHQLGYTLDSTQLSVMMNATTLGLHEGIWQVDLTVDDNLLRSSGEVRLNLLHDTQSPTVDLVIDDVISESKPFHVHTEFEDGYEGAAATYTWVISHENGTSRAPTPDEVQSNDHLRLNLSFSGVYGVEVTATDLSGKTVKVNKTFSVENLKPKAILTVDGLTTSPQQTIKLGPEQNWSISGLASMDNEPVEYLWVIDGSQSIRGVPELTREDFPSDGVFEVELIVFDDDGATDSAVVFAEITDPSEDASASVQPSVLGIGLLVVLVAAGGLLWQRSQSASDSELPKWQNVTVQSGFENMDDPMGDNATIQED